MPTKIEWCDETWNPITGCSPISEGCKNCYARRMARRLAGRHGYPEAPNHFNITFHSDRLSQPLKWKKPRKIFVCSMGDLFHEDVLFKEVDEIFDIITGQPHDFLFLTKRPKTMKQYCYVRDCKIELPIENIWLGVTAENQKRADERIPILLQIPAAIRFVSIEPMLEPVNLLTLREDLPLPAHFFYLDHLDWVIAGPETGLGARECKPEWIENLYNQCREINVPFFDKSKNNWMAREFPK